MAYTEKDWKDSPLTTTPLSAAAMEDLEMRTTDYVETVSPGVNVWESVSNGGTVTNWGPPINSLISGGAQHLVFGEHDYPFSTTITMESSTTFEGASGRGSPPTRLIWEGTGGGTAITAEGKYNVHFRELGIFYNSASFTGDLIALSGPVGGNAGGHKMEDCEIAYLSPAHREARCLVKLDRTVGTYFRNCSFRGAQSLVRGYEATAQDFSNTVTFRDCFVWDFDIAFCNVGWEWLFDNVTWEFTGCATDAVGIGSDLVHPSSVFTVCGQSSFWDAEYAGQQAIVQPVEVEWQMTLRDSTFHNSGRTYSDIDLQGTGAVVIERCSIGSQTPNGEQIDLGDVAANGANSRKTSIRIADCTGYPYVTNLKGHGQVQIENLDQAGPQVKTIGGYERISTRVSDQSPPTAANHAGYSAPAGFISEVQGNDGAGIILFNSANGAAPPGTAVDITFDTPLVPAYRTSGNPYLGVALTATSIGTAWPDAAAAVDAQPYVSINAAATYGTASETTGFSICFGGTVVQNSKFAFAYRVTQL